MKTETLKLNYKSNGK